MAQYVNMQELEEFGKFLHEYANNNIRDKIDKLLSLGSKYTWEGKAKETYFAKYKEIMTDLYDYSDMIEKFGYFLRYVSEGYMEVKKESDNKLKAYIDEVSAEDKEYLWRRG